MPKLALAIIAKDEVEKVKAIIEKYGQYFDEIAVAVDQRVDEFKALAGDKVKIHEYTWINDFSHKRNFLAEKIESEFYLRMDTDDELGNAQILPELFSQIVLHGIDVFYAPYDYAKDELGHTIARHWRETIIKKRPDVYWKKEIHENVFMDDQNTCKLSRDKKLVIIHNIDANHAAQSFERNFEYLHNEFQRDGEKTDPRTIAYLGRMMMAKGQWQQAILFLEKLIEKSGWNDDKYFAWIQMSQCYQQLNKLTMALSCCNEALMINTQFPDAYLQMGYVYVAKQDYVKAVDWIMPGVVRPEPDTCMVFDPTFYNVQAKMAAAMALLGKGDIEQAVQWYAKAKAAAPGSPEVLKYEGVFTQAYENLEYVRKLTWLIFFTKAKDPSKVQHIIDSIPSAVANDERVWAIRNNFTTPRMHAENEITIFCGNAWEEWCPASTLKGIGGSEEAVIYLGKELAKLGYKVTVYNTCGESAGTYDGVEYKPFFNFNPNDHYNILIEWRHAALVQVKARKKFAWLHDVPSDNTVTKEAIKSFDKIIVLSQYHRSLLAPWIPDEKVFVSTNGLNVADFDKPQIRLPQRMIYTSSYDRGLEHLLMVWGDVKKEVPNAELHIFYGWNTYDEMIKTGARDPRFKEVMVALMGQPGVNEHGRIGHKMLAKEFAKSGLWVYPTHFPEISCISAMKAQAAGCVPVCVNFAALSETVKAGVIIDGKCDNDKTIGEFRDKLIEILKDEDKQNVLREEVLKHKESFGWDKVAKSWQENIFAPQNISSPHENAEVAA